MKNRTNALLKNSNGNALPFVIIIGLILMLLVASLSSIAVGGINFTQSSVESRQAYIDAKSVTEYGQVMIDKKIEEMKILQLPVRTTPNQTGEVLFYINGDSYVNGKRPNLVEPISFETTTIPVSSTIGVCKLKWEPTIVTGDEKNGTAITTYTISVETQNLRRKLNYETSFDYRVETTTTSGTTPSTPGMPTVNPQGFNEQTKIEKGKDGLECKIKGYGIGNKKEKKGSGYLEVIPENVKQFYSLDINLTEFYFEKEKSLNIAANKVAISIAMPRVENATYKFGLYNELLPKRKDKVTTDLLYFGVGYLPDASGTTSKNILHAKNIIIINNLELSKDSTLDILCENLWITGTLSIKGTLINSANINTFTKSQLSALGIRSENIWIGGVKFDPDGTGDIPGGTDEETTTTQLKVYMGDENYY